MVARLLIALAVVAALLLGATALTFAGPLAQSSPESVAATTGEGESPLMPASPLGYYLWHNETGWHLRTHGPGPEHHFVARLHTDGVFTDVDAVRLESRDGIRLLDGGHTLVFDVHTYNWTDGVNFRVRGGTFVRFVLGLDGQAISTSNIYLGPNLKHPARNPFTIPFWRR